MITPETITQLALCQTKHNTWQGKLSSASWFAPRLVTVCRWRTKGQQKCLPSIWLAKPLPKKVLDKVSTDLCLHFQVSCLNSWTQSSELTNELNTWTTLGPQSTMLWNSPGTLGQSSRAIAKQDWDSQSKNAILESNKLISLAEPFPPENFHRKLGKSKRFSADSDSPKPKRTLQGYPGFVNHYRNYNPTMAQKLNPFYKLLEAETPNNVTPELKETFDSAMLVNWLWSSLFRENKLPSWLTQASEALVMPSWSKITQTRKKTIKAEKVRPRRVRIENFLPCWTENVHLLGRFFSILQGIIWVCTLFMGNNRANNRSEK